MKGQKNTTILYIAFWMAITLALGACRASNLSWSDLEFAQEQLSKFDSLEDIKEYIQKNQKINYILAYKAGLEHKEKKEFKSAVLMFAQAYYPDNYRKSTNYYPASIYEYVSSFSTKFKSKSPLANYALFELAECYSQLSENKFALKFLDLIDTNNEILKESSLYLQAKIQMKIDAQKSFDLFSDLIKKNPSPIYFLNLGSLYYKKKNTELALDQLFKALEFEKNAWTYKLATQEIISILKDNPDQNSKLTQRQNIMLIEGHRLKEDYPEALKTMKDIKDLKDENKTLFATYSAKLFISLKKFERVLDLKPIIENAKDNEEFYLEIGRQLIEQQRYYVTYMLIPAFHPKREISELRLAALNRVFSPNRKKEAIYTLSKQSNNSQIAERVFFNECFVSLEANNYTSAKDCLQELEGLTKGANTGGRARFYLGWIAHRQSNQEEAKKYFSDVYINSPEHFFVFRALKNIPQSNSNFSLPENDLPTIRRWITQNSNNDKAMKAFFEKKEKDQSYALDPIWKEWQKDFHDLKNNLTDEEMKAALYMLMGFSSQASKYLSKTDDISKKYLIHQKLGVKTKNTHQKYFYMKLYLKEKNHDIDIFTCPKEVLDMMYPTPYYDIVKKQAARFNVEPARIYALMKQESMFHPRVGSSAGAQGLMQVMPSTARGLNKKENIHNLDLKNPEHSIILGTRFFSDMSRMFKGHFEKIAAAYNAGPGRLLEWQTRFANVDEDLFFEKVPFEETYLYIQLTRRFYDRYDFLLRFK